MKHRSPLSVVLLSIVTLGIYDLYWLYKTKEILNKETQFKVPSILLLILPGIILAIGYIGIMVTVFTQDSSTTTNGAYGQTTTMSPHGGAFGGFLIATILGWILFFFISAFWFFKFSKAVNAYTSGKMSTAVTFLVLWIIHLIGVALVQDAFNDMAEGDQLTNSGGAPFNPTTPTAPNNFTQPVEPIIPVVSDFPSSTPPLPPAPTPPNPPVVVSPPVLTSNPENSEPQQVPSPDLADSNNNNQPPEDSTNS
jgi:hypothetical protein